MISTFVSHNREFLYKPRGFDNIWDMNNAIVENWNKIVDIEDDIYVLGDLMLNDNDEGARLIKSLKGKLHIVLGNHDSDTRAMMYNMFWNVEEVSYATVLKYNGYHFYLSHYPTFTANLEKESLKKCTINLYGHTHQKSNFYNDIPFMYHVGVDSHNCTPVLLDDVIAECEAKVVECKKQL